MRRVSSMISGWIVTAAILIGCASDGEGTGGTDDHLEAKPGAGAPVASAPKGALTDQQLADALKNAPKDLSEEDANAFVAQTLKPLATTARLKLLNDFIAKAPESEGRFFLGQAMEGVWWGTPRDLVSTPPGFGGQTLTTTVSVESGIAAPSRLTIKGDAKAAYTLDFMISSVKVSGVQIPAGAKPSAAAKLIAKALDALNEKLTDSIGSEKAFDAIGGDHAESPTGVDDVEISVSRGAVIIVVAQNG